MANYYTHFSFGFKVTSDQRLALLGLLDIIEGETWEEDSDIPQLFQDPDMPYLGVDFTFNGDEVYISDKAGTPDLEALAKVLQRAGIYPVGFTWADTCDKPRIDGFGGGACAIFKDRIEWESTSTRLKALLS